MIRIGEGDLLASDVEALVNTVNCVGIMGRGVALQFKEAFPANFQSYADACKRGEVQPGKMFVHETGHLTNPRLIINFPTKRHWRGDSRIEDIELGLEDLVLVISRLQVRSIALPPLGSGLGGLPWPAVRSRIVAALELVPDLEVILYEPKANGDRMKRHQRREQPVLTPLRAALVRLIDQYMRGLMEPEVTLLEIHKLAYFLQHSGLPMRLRFAKGHYGPYAENLRHVMREMDGYHLAGYGNGGDRPEKRIEIVPGTLETAESVLADNETSAAAFKRIAELVEGFETPFGLELLATTHWAVESERAQGVAQVEAIFQDWNERKSRFTSRQIGIAYEHLSLQGWLSTAD